VSVFRKDVTCHWRLENMICGSRSAFPSVLVQTLSKLINQNDAVDVSAQPHLVSVPWSFTSTPLCTFMLYIFILIPCNRTGYRGY